MLINVTDRQGKIAAEIECVELNTFWGRFKGLMLRSQTDPKVCYKLSPCKQIHMMFMRFSLDAVFVDHSGEVVHIVHGLKPWTISPYVKYAKYVLEAVSGGCLRALNIGDLLT